MACGVPVVGAHATALPETIGSGGLTFQPEDSADLAQKALALLESLGDRQLPPGGGSLAEQRAESLLLEPAMLRYRPA
jgi:glycosyltransferase involved in cell wall biosynthesis